MSPRRASSTHGTRAMYVQGCRCAPCRHAHSVYQIAWRERYRRNGPTRIFTDEEPVDTTMVNAAPFTEVIRYLACHGHSVNSVALFCGIGQRTAYDLFHGKRSVQQATAEKLRRMVQLLPSEVAS